MARNGSGTYSLPAGNPVVTGTTISSTTHNNTLSDIATALTASLAKDGQTVPTANLPMGGYKLTGLGAATTAGDAVRYEQAALQAGEQVQLYTAFTTGGTSTAFTLTPTPAITANTTNQRFRVKFNAASGATPTLAVSGQTAKNLKYYDSTGTKQAITSTQVPINWISDVEYDGTDWVVLQVVPEVMPSSASNPIINGAFSINQRAPASNADDTYAHDRWNVLTQTGTIAVSTLADVEDTTPFMARLTQSQASAQRMGYSQIIEGKDCKHLRGQQVTFRFGRKRLSASANVRIAVLEWTGTEDAVTSDVVLDWTSATYTAGNFFLAANLTVSSVVQQALTANTLTTGSSVTVTLGSTFNNLIVFAWTEGTAAQNVTLDLAKAQLEAAATASSFKPRSITDELFLCMRYCEKSFPQGTTPAQASGVANAIRFTQCVGASTVQFAGFPFTVPKRVTPTTLTLYNPASANAQAYNNTIGDCSSTSVNVSNSVGFHIVTTTPGGSSAGQGISIHWMAEAEL